MANTFKQQQQDQQQAKHDALVGECKKLPETGGRVEAVRKYRAATGASLKTAQHELFGK